MIPVQVLGGPTMLTLGLRWLRWPRPIIERARPAGSASGLLERVVLPVICALLVRRPLSVGLCSLSDLLPVGLPVRARTRGLALGVAPVVFPVLGVHAIPMALVVFAA